MKVQSFLASSGASLAYIAQQTVAWAAHTVFILQANPATVVITCIALVALGTAAYVFSRLHISEKNLNDLNDKMSESQKVIQAYMERANHPQQVVQDDEASANNAEFNQLHLQSISQEITSLKEKCNALSKDKDDLQEDQKAFKDSLDKVSSILVSLGKVNETSSKKYQDSAQSVTQKNEELSIEINRLSEQIISSTRDQETQKEMTKTVNKRVIDLKDIDIKSLKEKFESLSTICRGFLERLNNLDQAQLQANDLLLKNRDLTTEFEKELKKERQLVEHEISELTTTMSSNLRNGLQISEENFRKEMESLNTMVNDLDKKRKVWMQDTYRQLYNKLKALSKSSEVDTKPRSNSTPAQIQTPIKNKLVPISEETLPAATLHKEIPLNTSDTFPITKSVEISSATAFKGTSQKKMSTLDKLTPSEKLVNENLNRQNSDPKEIENPANVGDLAEKMGVNLSFFNRAASQTLTKTQLQFGNLKRK